MKKEVLEVVVDSELKDNAEIIYEDLGVDLSTAVNIFLRYSVLNRGFPFDLMKIPSQQEDLGISKDYLIRQAIKEIEDEKE